MAKDFRRKSRRVANAAGEVAQCHVGLMRPLSSADFNSSFAEFRFAVAFV
ncbi:hypothetical protein PLANPX_3488 [Lacipirellula parvula]|uniref:Uncharacterized protein n=1 Tax=Lacipirellula parvula TaxID=2650471 RepID=A0A5K7XHW3_9BACT|nr:hypothetical protein PLANPX_3488 [Lacipirellula parvula]